MAKKFRLSKGFFTGSSCGSHRLSKAAKGKGIVGSLDLFSERDMVLDDMGPEDFRADWVWPSRLAKARVAAEARIHELFDSEYEPWEEVRGNWDHSDSEDVEDEVKEFPNQYCGGSSAFTNFHFRESSQPTVTVEAKEADGIGCLGVVSKDPMVSSGCAAMESKVDYRFPSGGSGSVDSLERPKGPGKNLVSRGGMKFRHRTKKVIMGREFLLVRRHCFRDSDKRFQFFHMPSLSDVEVKVLEPYLTDSHPCSPDGHLSHEDCVKVLEEVDNPLVGEPDLTSPSRMEVMEEIHSSPTSCVTASPIPDHHQLSVEESSSDRVGGEDDSQDSALGPQNLRAKRIVAFRRYRLDDCDNGFVRYSGKQKRTKVVSVEGSIGGAKVLPHPIRRKRSRERVIEADPHSYRALQRRAFS